MDDVINPSGVVAWLTSCLGGKRLTPRQDQVMGVLRAQPRLASYSSVTDVAVAANANASTVTRTAQALGYEGWTDFQVEFRSRYLASLSAVEVAAEHGSRGQDPCQLALTTDQSNLAFLARQLDPGTVHDAAKAIARARRTWVVASGSYAVPGRALEHNVGIAGYDIRLLSDVAALVNSMARVVADDVVVIFSLWRVYDSTARAARLAAAAGAHVVVVSDDHESEIVRHADTVLIVPSEGAGFFPSLVPSLAIAEAIAVEVASVDPQRSQESIRSAENTWEAMGIMLPRR